MISTVAKSPGTPLNMLLYPCRLGTPRHRWAKSAPKPRQEMMRETRKERKGKREERKRRSKTKKWN